jgi:hypothetical protein
VTATTKTSIKTFLVGWTYSMPAEHPYSRQIGRKTAEFSCFTAAHDFALELELKGRKGIRIISPSERG